MTEKKYRNITKMICFSVISLVILMISFSVFIAETLGVSSEVVIKIAVFIATTGFIVQSYCRAYYLQNKQKF